MATPEDLKYTAEHEWVRQQGEVVRIGITDYAQAQLGDIVFVSLPELGSSVAAGDPMGEIESTKSVSEVYAPMAGQVTARNEALDAQPELVNTDPYGDGWMVELTVSADAVEGAGLMDSAGYDASTGGDG